MTMTDLKPHAVTEFNLYVTDEFAREYFADSFDLWPESESKYTAENNGYKVIIKRHINAIQAAIKQADTYLKAEYTKRITALNSVIVNEIGNKDITDDRTQTDGEFIQSQLNYPDGYIDTPDTAYISAQTKDSEYIQTDNNVMAEDSTRDTTSSGTADTEEADILSVADRLTAYTSAFDVIERCVFALVAGSISGRF